MKAIEYENRGIVITSILLAIFVDVKTLNLIVSAAFPSLVGLFMSATYFFVVIGLLFMGLLVQRRSFLQLRHSYLAINIICILWYVLTEVFVAPSSVSLPYFGIFMVASFLIPGIVRIDMRTFLLTTLLLPFWGVFFINQMFYSEIMETGIISMGTSYALLVPILGSIVYIRFFYRKETALQKLVLLPFLGINISYLIYMTMFGSRGPALCAFLLILCCIIFKIDDNEHLSIRKGRFVVIAICLVFFAISFLTILQELSNFLAQYNISFNVIDKFLNLNKQRGDILNGREDIIYIAWQGILETPIWGKGTSQFLNNTGIVYPHNFLVQMLYDGGIILTLSIMLPIIQTLVNKIKTASENEYICLLFLLFASVPSSFFSGDLWESYRLWIFFGFVLAKNSVVDDYKSTCDEDTYINLPQTV